MPPDNIFRQRTGPTWKNSGHLSPLSVLNDQGKLILNQEREKFALNHQATPETITWNFHSTFYHINKVGPYCAEILLVFSNRVSLICEFHITTVNLIRKVKNRFHFPWYNFNYFDISWRTKGEMLFQFDGCILCAWTALFFTIHGSGQGQWHLQVNDALVRNAKFQQT